MSHVLSQLRVVEKVECSEAVALAKELGLEIQARRYEKPLAEQAFTALTADEETLWRDYCPTRYVAGGGGGVRALEQYAFDSVPVEVMRHWKSVKDIYAFDRYEVWTTERTAVHSDPLLVGFIGVSVYILARWGLESPESMPVQELARRAMAGVGHSDWKWYFRHERYNRVVCAAIRLSGVLHAKKEPTEEQRKPNFLQRLLGMEHNA